MKRSSNCLRSCTQKDGAPQHACHLSDLELGGVEWRPEDEAAEDDLGSVYLDG